MGWVVQECEQCHKQKQFGKPEMLPNQPIPHGFVDGRVEPLSGVTVKYRCAVCRHEGDAVPVWFD